MSSEVLFLKDKSVRVVEVGCLFLNLGGFQQDNGDWRMLLHDIIPTPEKWFSKQYMYLVGWMDCGETFDEEICLPGICKDHNEISIVFVGLSLSEAITT